MTLVASVVKQDAHVPTHQATTGFVIRPFLTACTTRFDSEAFA